jgi:hypothetical protein
MSLASVSSLTSDVSLDVNGGCVSAIARHASGISGWKTSAKILNRELEKEAHYYRSGLESEEPESNEDKSRTKQWVVV